MLKRVSVEIEIYDSPNYIFSYQACHHTGVPAKSVEAQVQLKGKSEPEEPSFYWVCQIHGEDSKCLATFTNDKYTEFHKPNITVKVDD